MMKSLLVVFAALVMSFTAAADSPLTSTFFAGAYADNPHIAGILAVRGVEEKYNFELTPAMISFLDNPAVGLDTKVALINALGWGSESNTAVYKKHLESKYKIDQAGLDSLLVMPSYEESTLPEYAMVISNHDLVILGYLQIMGNYFEPARGILLLENAFVRNQGSEATGWIYGLLAGQIYLDVSWCDVYLTLDAIAQLPYTEDLLREEAKKSIWEYIGLYEESCAELQMDDTVVEFEQDIFTEEYYMNNPVYTKSIQQNGQQKGSTVDLVIVNEAPEKSPMYTDWVNYDEMINGTSIVLKITNKGNTKSLETNLALNNLPDETDGFGALHRQYLLPAIEPGQTIELTITISDFWIYDPNADFEVILDYDNNILEKDENNNIRRFYENG